MRYKADVDTKNDVVTLIDEKGELKTDFDSELLLAPVDDAVIVIAELNRKEAIIKVLYDALLTYEDPQDIDYWIKSALEEME